MAWNKIEPATGKTKYIKKFGDGFLLTTSPKGASEELPEGWDVKPDKKGILRQFRI